MDFRKCIAIFLRIFHVLFWLLLMTGCIFITDHQTIYLCVVIMMIAIMSWNIIGFCFLHMLENHFDPVRTRNNNNENEIHEFHRVDSASYFNEELAQKIGMTPEAFATSFEYLVYSIVLIGLFRVYKNIKDV